MVFFTDNPELREQQPREQAPILAFQGHLIRTIRPGFWVAADGNYWKGGRITTNGNPALVEQENSRLGATLAVPIRRQQVRVSYSFGAYTTIGGDYHSVGTSYSYAWAAARAAMVTRFLPGLAALKHYDPSWLRFDLLAGVSVAAVAVPIAIAYSQLAGVPPAHGLYASILPLLAYAVFGSSRQLIMAPDAATCAIVAATVLPLAGRIRHRYVSLTVALAIATGIVCIAAGLARLGFLTNFLARPILTGYLNGIAHEHHRRAAWPPVWLPAGVRRLLCVIADFVSKLGQTHGLTLAIGVGMFLLLRVLKRRRPSAGAARRGGAGHRAASLFDLDHRGVALLGAIPAGLPPLTVPDIRLSDLAPLVLGAVGLALISFNSAMVTARGFALKNRYEIDSNQEFIALGVADIGAGLLQGFADQRRGLADGGQRFGGRQEPGDRAGGGRSAGPGAAVPHRPAGAPAHHRAGGRARSTRRSACSTVPSLSGCAGSAARNFGCRWSRCWVSSPSACCRASWWLSAWRCCSSWPGPRARTMPCWAESRSIGGYRNIAAHPEAVTIPGLVIYRFDASLLFFNSDYFKSRARTVVNEARGDVRFFVLDAGAMPHMDTTGAATLEEVIRELSDRGTVFGLAEARAPVRSVLDRTGLTQLIGSRRLFPTLESAVESVHSGML